MVVDFLILGCGRSMQETPPVASMMEAEVVPRVIWTSREESPYLFGFMLQDGELYAARMVFPGYTEHEWFSCAVDASLVDRWEEWCHVEGNVTPPIDPGGVAYCRVDVCPDRPDRESPVAANDNVEMFSNDYGQVAIWLDELRTIAVQDANRLNGPPAFIVEDESVAIYFGFFHE